MSLRSDCLLAVTGCFPKEITPRDHLASQAIPDAWSKRLTRWIKNGEQTPFKYTPPKDLDKLFSQLAVPPNEIDVAGWIEGLGIEDAELQADYFMGLMRARSHVVAIWPKFSVETSAGPQILPLSYDDQHEVWAVIQVLDDPDRLLDEVEARTLTPSQALAFRTCYPDLYALADQALAAAMAEMRAKAKGLQWDPGWEREAVINTLRGKPPEVPLAPPPPPAPPKVEVDVNSEREQTQAEVSSAPKGAE